MIGAKTAIMAGSPSLHMASEPEEGHPGICGMSTEGEVTAKLRTWRKIRHLTWVAEPLPRPIGSQWVSVGSEF